MNKGFVLSDALIAIAVVSIAVMISAASLRSGASAQERIHESYALSDAQYAEALLEIGECQCTEEAAENEADTSLNSY